MVSSPVVMFWSCTRAENQGRVKQRNTSTSCPTSHTPPTQEGIEGCTSVPLERCHGQQGCDCGASVCV